MQHKAPVEQAREAIAWHLSSLGVNEPGNMRETMLIHNGLFCGRKYQCEDYEVVWFLEEDEIKFFSPIGELLIATSAIECIRNFEGSQETRRAA